MANLHKIYRKESLNMKAVVYVVEKVRVISFDEMQKMLQAKCIWCLHNSFLLILIPHHCHYLFLHKCDGLALLLQPNINEMQFRTGHCRSVGCCCCFHANDYLRRGLFAQRSRWRTTTTTERTIEFKDQTHMRARQTVRISSVWYSQKGGQCRCTYGLPMASWLTVCWTTSCSYCETSITEKKRKFIARHLRN